MKPDYPHLPISFDQAEAVMRGFAAQRFFPAEEEARAEITDSILTLVNPKDPSKPVNSTKTPTERLEFLRINMRKVSIVTKGWPGIGEMEAIYCMMFPPGDGMERPFPTTAGYTAEDNAAGTYVPLLPSSEPELLLLEEEKLTPEQITEMSAGFTQALARMTGQ